MRQQFPAQYVSRLIVNRRFINHTGHQEEDQSILDATFFADRLLVESEQVQQCNLRMACNSIRRICGAHGPGSMREVK
jgi:hypothetical protein